MTPEQMAELAARLHAMTTATKLDEYDIKTAAALIESMAQRRPLSEEEILKHINEKPETPRPCHRAGPRHQERKMNEWKVVPVEPTREMIEAGAQRLVSWEEGCVWPDSWSPLQVSAARNEADRVWRSMWLAAAPKPGATWQPVEAGYTAMLAAAPTPPVVLPPPPQSFTILSRLQSGTEEVVRLDEAIAYARAALAAYGIVDRQEAAA